MSPERLPNVPHPAGVAGIEIVFLERPAEEPRGRPAEPRERERRREGKVRPA